MELHLRQEGTVVVLYVEGNIDIDSALFIETTGELIRQGNLRILCDFKNVGMIDYNGLSILTISYRNVINKNGMMKFCNVPAHVKELLKSARLDLILDVYEDTDTAIRAFEIFSKIDKLYLRRRFKRLEIHTPIKFTLSNVSQPKMYSGRMLNIGGGGIYIQTKHTFPVSTELDMELTLEEKKIYKLQASVIWVADKELQPHLYPGMGVEFLKLDYATQKDIMDFIDKNMTHRSNL